MGAHLARARATDVEMVLRLHSREDAREQPGVWNDCELV